MGYAYYEIDGKPCGYSVLDVCNFETCQEEIDRGLAYACGGYPGESEHYCDGYFCPKHLFLGIDPEIKQLCPNCLKEWEEREDEMKRQAKRSQVSIDIEETQKVKIEFNPHYLYIGVWWWKTHIGWSMKNRQGYQIDIVLCFIPMLPIKYTRVRKLVSK